MRGSPQGAGGGWARASRDPIVWARLLPELVNELTPRKDVKELTGNYWVPVLVTDEGAVIQGSGKIIAWAEARPAVAAA